MLKPDPGSNGILQIVTFGMPGPVMNLPTMRSQIPASARVVLTNGVFDLLHVGHLRYLRAARALGDLLVVGVNADISVRKPGRPLVPEAERAELVAALEPVDYVVIFAEPTASSLVRELRPRVYVKGADYADKPLPEADAAREVGAEVVLIPLVADRSTTRLAELLRSAHG
jgi:rfaE bifunctional protein nucleotidyltransferase chain/domain